MFVTLPMLVVHAAIFLLKDVAFSNILNIVNKLVKFQAEISWSKAEALLNMKLISVTFETFQFAMFSLKLEALRNIPFISVTFETFQLLHD